LVLRTQANADRFPEHHKLIFETELQCVFVEVGTEF